MTAKLFATMLTFFVSLAAMSNEINSNEINSNDKNCEPLKAPVKYKFEKNDHVAAVLRKFDLEPVFGRNKYLDKTLKLNNLKKADSVSAGDTLFLPFACENDAQKWTLKMDSTAEFRLVTPVKSVKVAEVFPSTVTNSAVTAAATTAASTAVVSPFATDENKTVVEPTPIPQDMDARLREIISPPKNEVDPESIRGKLDLIDKQKKASGAKEEVSEALRYRMICDGEWDGDQCIPRYSVVYASLSGWFNRYDGTDPSVSVNNKGVLLSRFNPELTLGWSHFWMKNIRSRLQASFKQNSFLPEAREVPIEQNEKLLTDFLAEIRYETGVWGFGLGFKQFDKLFYRFRFSGLSAPCIGGGAGFTGCGIFVHAANVSMLYANASWLFYQAGKFSSGLLFTVGRLGSSNTAGWTIEPGTAWNLEFRVQHDRVQEFLFGTISYGQQSQNTSIEIQSASELGLTAGYAWKLKDW